MADAVKKGYCPVCGRRDVLIDATGSLIQHVIREPVVIGGIPEQCVGGGRRPGRAPSG